jgi:ribose transport system substrate-binding protein
VFLYILVNFAFSYQNIKGLVRQIEDKSSSAPSRQHFVLISQELANPFWRTVEQGARKAAEELDMEMEYIGPFRNNLEEQVKLLDKYIAAKVDGFLVQGIQGEEYTRLINKAISLGIAVLTLDADAPGSQRLSYVGTDNLAAGKQLGETLVWRIGTKANIGVIIGSSEAMNQELRFEGFRSVIESYPDLHIVEVGISNISRIQAGQVAEQMLKNHPEIQVMVGTSALDGLGIMQAARNLKLAGRISIFGFDDLPETSRLLFWMKWRLW